MSKPTPRPWTSKEMGNIGFNGEFECWILFGEDASLASVRRGASDEEYGDDDTVRANAAHIIRCVNMHEELVEALKSILWELEDGDSLRVVQSAIAKAEGRDE